jgi:hypothetical protein
MFLEKFLVYISGISFSKVFSSKGPSLVLTRMLSRVVLDPLDVRCTNDP